MKINLMYAFLVGALSFGVSANAQKYNVESMKIELTDEKTPDIDKDFANLLELAAKTLEHPKTSNNPEMWYYRGLTYLKLTGLNNELTKANPDALDKALEAFNNAISTDAKGKVTKQAEAGLLNVAIGLYNRGYTAYKAEEYDKSYTAFGLALPLMKYDVNGLLKQNNLTPEVLEQMMAYSAMNDGDDDKASKALQNLIDKGSIDPAIFTSLAQLKLKGGDTTGALATIQAGKEINSTDKSLINFELDVYLKQGRSEELIAKLGAAIDEDPGNTIYYFARATSYERLGKTKEASADYDKILEIDPEYYDARYNKGVMYLNEVAAIVDKLDGVFDAKIVEAEEAKIDGFYELAIAEFEKIFEDNADMPIADKVELAGTMKKIYARLQKMDKYAAMKAFVEENE